MIGWIIFGGILLLLWLIGMIRAVVEVEYNTGVRISVKVLGKTFRIKPKERKTPRLSDFTPKKYRKRLKKDEKRRLKKEAKKARAAEKKAAKKAAKKGTPSPDGKKVKKKKKKEPAEIMEYITMGLDALKALGISFGKRLEIEAVRMKIAVGGSDAAQVALLYGVIVQFAAYLYRGLSALPRFRCKNPEEFDVTADFLSDKIRVDLHFIFKLRVWHLLAMLLAAAVAAMKRLLINKTEGDKPSASDAKKTVSPTG